MSIATDQGKPQWLFWENGFTNEECDKIIELCSELPAQEGSTFGGHGPGGRDTQIRWVKDTGDEISELHMKMRQFCQLANESWGTQLTHLPPLQYTEYNDVGSHYDWHHDINWSRTDGFHRKVSICVQLTEPDEYEGGDFSFRYLEQPDAEAIKKRGTVLCFLSYHYHAVSPIESGERKSLVGWYEGPEWR